MIETERLCLTEADISILTADLRDHAALSRALSAEVPDAWPPSLYDTDALEHCIHLMETGSDPHIRIWYWILKRAGDMGILVGSGGILSHTVTPGTVMIGYSVLEAFQNRGYATEAIRILIPEIFTLPGVDRIIATTYPHLKASIRVLEKNGFVQIPGAAGGQGIEEGTLAYIRGKADRG